MSKERWLTSIHEDEANYDWRDPEEGHFCGSIKQNADGSFTGHGSIEGSVTINGETYTWARDVKFKLKKKGKR